MTDWNGWDDIEYCSLMTNAEAYPAIARNVKKKFDIRKMTNVVPNYKECLTNDDRTLLNMLFGWSSDYVDELLKYETDNIRFQTVRFNNDKQ